MNDDAADGLDEGDKEVLKSEQASCPGKLKQSQEFKKAHTQPESVFITISLRQPKDQTHKKAKTSKKAFSECQDEKFDISQPEAKQYLPPKACIWRTAHGPVARWNGHCPPAQRCGESFGPGGLSCSQALQVVLKEL